MIDDTINNKNTVAGDGKDVVLAGRYHILRQLGRRRYVNTAIFVICEKITK